MACTMRIRSLSEFAKRSATLSKGVMMSGGSQQHVVFKNELEISTSTTPKSFLLGISGSTTYTTARTLNRTSIIDYETHLNRLALGVQQSNQHVRSIIEPTIKHSISTYIQRYSISTNDITDHDELRLYLALAPSQDNQASLDSYVFVEPLSDVPTPPIAVEIREFHRENPTLKSVEWVRQRKIMEDQMASDVNEVVMTDHEGRLYEGLSSNFFVVQNGALITAEEEFVLAGTMANMVLDICRSDGITVQRERPSFKNIEQWSGSFITSTSRQVLPIQYLREMPPAEGNSDEVREWCFEHSDPLIERLQRRIREEFQKRATSVV